MDNKLWFTSILMILFLSLRLLSCPVTARREMVETGTPGLVDGFYSKTCPQVGAIVEEVVKKATLLQPSLKASLIRLYFHDCFVKGCDASILLESTPSGEETEINSPANLGIKGLDVIDEIKARLEEECPGIVSCADIISFATREAVAAAGITPYPVQAGRRDGLSSVASTVTENLPAPDATVAEMTKLFNSKGLDKADLVALLGAHSIGVIHCSTIEDELYNVTSSNNTKLDKLYALILKSICLPPGSPLKLQDNVFPLNELLGFHLSTSFYQNVFKGKAILPSDQGLRDDPQTSAMVKMYASLPLLGSTQWGDDFRNAMVKLGKVEVLTGDQGEIRKTCRTVNQR